MIAKQKLSNEKLKRLQDRKEKLQTEVDRKTFLSNLETNRRKLIAEEATRTNGEGFRFFSVVPDHNLIDRNCVDCGKLDRVHPNQALCNECSDRKEN